jgi:hypothetical protein
LPLVSPSYLEKSESSPFSRTYLEPSQRMTGNARYEQMRINLIEALRDEAILIVLDNFETNLTPRPPSLRGNGEKAENSPLRSDLFPQSPILKGEGKQAENSPLRFAEGLGSGFADPQWDNLLKALCQELPDTDSLSNINNSPVKSCNRFRNIFIMS